MQKNTSIYLHVPWCRRRCPYCDFYLVVGSPDQGFASAIKTEWRSRRALWHEGSAQTLYFGGGTPSLLTPESIGSLVSFFIHEGVLATDAEITLEANPEDITEAFAHDLLSHGINRISLGVQSFDDQTLLTLGRKHKGCDARLALKHLQKAGFTNISVDLIIGLLENHASLLTSIDYLYEHNIPHISAYLLTIEEGTSFARRIKQGLLKAPCDDGQASTYALVQGKLKALGYQQYDISSYAKPGLMSRHNQIYWGQGPYIGIGPGAHSMRFLADGTIERAHNKTALIKWLKNPMEDISYEALSPHEALRESLAFALRNMDQGVDIHHLASRHNAPLPAGLPKIIEKLKNFGWLLENSTRLFISPKGALFADAIMRDILTLD